MIIGTVNPHYTFDRISVAGHNQFAHAATLAVCEHPGKTYNPLYIYGDAGDDRAHLLNAICNQLNHADPSKTIILTSGPPFLTELLDAFQHNNSEEFRIKYETADMVVINDLQRIATKAGAIEELFSIMKARYREQKQIVLASDCHPKEFQDFEKRMHSLFEWGLIADIEPPGLEAISMVVERVAVEMKISLTGEAVRFIANDIEPYLINRSITKFVEDILNHLATHESSNLSQLSYDQVRQALPQILRAISLRGAETNVQVVDVSPLVLQMLNRDFSQIYKFDPEQFETLICERLSRMGFGVERVGSTYAPDGGVDIVAWPSRPTPFPFLLAVQVKHHRRPSLKTGPGAVKDLQAVLASRPFQAGVLVTNTTFTPNAKWFASNSHHIVRLRDIEDLKRWVKGDFSNISDWREVPAEIELAPGIVIKIPNSYK